MYAPRPQEQSAIRTDLGTIFVSLELSRSTWLITSLSPGVGEKLSKHSVSAGDIAGLLARFAQLWQKAAARLDRIFPIIAIQEAGLDEFWIHRVLENEGIESHVVDAASILTSRRRRQAKTDRVDGETLVRTLMAHKQGVPDWRPRPGRAGRSTTSKGVSKAGNPRLRTTMIQVAWLWTRHQPGSALSLWFQERVQRNGGRMRKSTSVALARKLLVAFWKYVTSGVVIEGALMQSV